MKITLINPFDAHVHFRQGDVLTNILPYTIAQFSGALAMPNTNPTITSLAMLKAYRNNVFEVIKTADFFPIFTFYLSAELKLEELKEAWEQKLFHGIKYYPKGGTTNSSNGMLGFKNVTNILNAMELLGIPLLIHGETPDINGELVDDFEREAVFYTTEMEALRTEFPYLKIVLEHITTKEAVDFALKHKNIRATITPQHLLFDRRSLFNYNEATSDSYILNTKKSGCMPDFVCRPILKHQRDVQALKDALIFQAKNKLGIFGLGTDTAYHPKEKKYCECGACGVFSAPIALELYAMAFEQMGILDHLQTFAGEAMPNFYGIKDLLPNKTITLVKEPQKVEESYFNATTPFAGQILPWSVKH